MKRKIKIEEITPYQDSLKWKIHYNYFQKRGGEAWKTREVPFDITSNSQAAYQNAYVVYRMIDTSNHKKGEKINILEIASGLGIFALNFIKTFTDICEKNDKDYHHDLHYMFTDFSPKSLIDASKNKYLNRMKEQGILDFYILDALNPQAIKNLDGTDYQMKSGSIDAVIANYLYCTLPIRILRKKDNKFYENNIELHMLLNEDEKDYNESEIASMIDNPVAMDLLTRLEEVNHYLEVNINNYIEDEILRSSFIDLLKDMKVATAELPIGACESINKLLPFLKNTGGIIISDKGYADTDYMLGEHECFVSTHGNSFAHSLNFPLMEIYFEKKGIFSTRTSDYLNSLQVMLIRKEMNDDIEREFDNQFINTNYNEDTHDYMDTAYKEKSEKNFSRSVKYYLRAIKYRVHDARIYFDLGNAYIGYGDQNKALEYLLNRPDDYLDEFDFDFEIGMAYDYLQNYQKALEYYHSSMEKFPNQKETFFNIANVNHKIRNYKEAYTYYQKALDIMPAYEIALNGMKNLKEDMFTDWLRNNNMETTDSDYNELYKKAEKAFNDAISNSVDIDNLWQACEMFLEIVEKAPNNSYAHAKLALIFYILGDIENCRKYMHNSNVLNPNSQEILKLEKLLEGQKVLS